jgi:TetR/AcrR family transcriptional repressor of nem operon
MSTRDKVLAIAERLIQTRGYNGFSFDDIAREVGVRKPSLYHHFATKADLGAAVVRGYTRKFAGALARIEQDHDDADEALARYVRLFTDTYATSCQLCLCGILGAEKNTLPDGIREELAGFFDLNMAWLTTLIGKGQRDGRLAAGNPPEKAAQFLLSSLEGAMIVGRGTGSSGNVAEVGAMALAYMAGMQAGGR